MIATTLFWLCLLMGAAMSVAASMAMLSFILSVQYSTMPLIRALGEIGWSTCNDSIIMAVPLYILMGEILMRAGIAERMYEAMRQWMSWLPGGLMNANIGFCAVFSASSGSAVATAATIGTVAHPRDEAPRLQRAAVSRNARRRRHARHPDPALDQPDRLRRADQHLDPAALSRGLPARLHLRLADDPDDHRRLPVAAAMGRAAEPDRLADAPALAAGPDSRRC